MVEKAELAEHAERQNRTVKRKRIENRRMNMNELKKVYSADAPAAIGPYSQAVIAGTILYASGQIPIDPVSGEVSGSTIETQAEQIMKNIAAVLKEAGTDFAHVVKTTCFLSDMADFAVFNAVYETYFTGKPARSCVAVKGLPKSVLAEVEVIAVLL